MVTYLSECRKTNLKQNNSIEYHYFMPLLLYFRINKFYILVK